jgi:hypothetical protein
VAITSAQVFVRADEPDRLVRVLTAYLDRSLRGAPRGASDAPMPFAGPDGSRRVMVLAPVSGWALILDSDPYRADMALAEHVSKALSTTAVLLEIQGGELSWRYVAFEEGTVAREEAEPREAFDAERPTGEGPMPFYPDATREALLAAKREGLPQIYLFLRQDEIVEDVAAELRHVRIAASLVAERGGRTVKASGARLAGVRRMSDLSRDDVRFRADIAGEEDGRPVLVEVRSLFGTASADQADNLLEIERADTNRLQEPHLGNPSALVPLVRFEYTSRGMSEEALKSLLDQRRPAYQAKRPTKEVFLGIALEAARKAAPGWEDVRPSGFGLNFRFRGRENSVDLDVPYDGYMDGTLPAGSPKEAVERFLAQAARDLEGANMSADFDAISDLLLPCLMSAEEAAKAEKEGVPTAPVGHGVKAAVVCQVGEGTALIDSDDLAKWSADFAQALDAARRNLESRMRRDSRALIPMAISPDKKALAYLAGGQTAALLLVPGLARMMGEILKTDDIICAVPDQNSLFAVPAGDEEAVEALRKFARERMLSADRPLTPELFRVSQGRVSEA